MRLVYGLSFIMWNEYLERQLCDERWCGAFADAAAHVAHSASSRPGHAAVVCVLGLGSGVTAMAAARAGGEVSWYERALRFMEVAKQLSRRNGLEKRIQHARVQRWEDFVPQGVAGAPSPRFDAVMTEEVGDDLLGDGLLRIARHAHAHLLRSGGTFVPARARVYGALASLRVDQIAGFDLGAFNAFRSNDSIWIDLEHIAACDHFAKLGGRLLSEPVHLFDFDFTSEAALPPLRREHMTSVVASADGVANCVTWWYVLDLADGCTSLDLGPNLAAPREFHFRARRQKVHYLPYDRRIVKGETVRLHAAHDDISLHVDAPADGPAEAAAATAGHLVPWPRVNALAYHFPMIADEGRNGAFDRALVAAVGRFKRAHGGRGPRVLDIGSGSGLLAMMAARAGACAVHSLEMVPALAAVARQIVLANGFDDVVSIHGAMSTDLQPDAVGGAFDILVCEIVDDQLLGEGVLTTIDDARKRLLAAGAQVIPSGASVHTQPVELRVGSIAGFRCDDLNLFATDATLAPKSSTGCKLQTVPTHRHRTLAPPIDLFDFDFANGDLTTLAAGRQRTDLRVRIDKGGVLSAFLVYFTLRCDDSGANDFHSGPANPKLVAWDQSLRTLPIELHVSGGDVLPLTAEHNHEMVRVGLPHIRPEMTRDEHGAPTVGHLEAIGAPP